MTKYLSITAAAIAALCLASCGQGGEAVKQDDGQNPVIEAIMSRRSIRKYKDTPVEREKLQLIAECGVNAPNGMNAQRWEVRIVDNAESIAAISEEYKKANPQLLERDPGFKNMFRNAPAVICVAVNKVKGIRCALCTDSLQAEMTRRHNDANMMALGAGITGGNLAKRMVEIFLNTEFEGGRHARRVALLDAIQ